MRLFVILGLLLVTLALYLLVDAGIRVSQCFESGLFSYEIWRKEFWLFNTLAESWRLSENAHWFVRVVGGLLSLPLGLKVIRVASR